MTLDNLLAIGQLKKHDPEPAEIQRLIEAAKRNIADSRVTVISSETQFDAAYKAIMQMALAGLMANGFRPDTNRAGHHMTVLQSLPKTIGLAASRTAVLDTLRRKRNLADYTGEDIDDSSVAQCIEEAVALLQDVEQWLAETRPDLVSR